MVYTKKETGYKKSHDVDEKISTPESNKCTKGRFYSRTEWYQVLVCFNVFPLPAAKGAKGG